MLVIGSLKNARASTAAGDDFRLGTTLDDIMLRRLAQLKEWYVFALLLSPQVRSRDHHAYMRRACVAGVT